MINETSSFCQPTLSLFKNCAEDFRITNDRKVDCWYTIYQQYKIADGLIIIPQIALALFQRSGAKFIAYGDSLSTGVGKGLLHNNNPSAILLYYNKSERSCFISLYQQSISLSVFEYYPLFLPFYITLSATETLLLYKRYRMRRSHIASAISVSPS